MKFQTGDPTPEWGMEKIRYYVELPGDIFEDGYFMDLVKIAMGPLWMRKDVLITRISWSMIRLILSSRLWTLERRESLSRLFFPVLFLFPFLPPYS